MPDLQNLLSPAVAFFIGFGVLIFSYRQWRIAQHKLRLDLFEKRYKVYEAAGNFLSLILMLANFNDEDLRNFNRGTMDATFLFRPEVASHLKEIRSRALKMRLYQKKFEPLPPGPERSALVQQNHDEICWLNEQTEKLPIVFKPYLDFSTMK